MNLGAEPKKVVILGGLMLVAAYLMYSNVISPSGSDTTSAAVSHAPSILPTASRAAQVEEAAGVAVAETQAENDGGGPRTSRGAGNDTGVQEYRPSLKAREGKDKLDPAKIDPTLELFRLERLKTVAINPGGRNVFEFGAAPPPPVPDVKILPKQAAIQGPPKPAPPPPEPVKPQPPPPPQAPPIPLKFYGFEQRDFEQRARKGGSRRGLFLQGGEKIFVASEGDLIDRRYKVVSIQDRAAVLEDTQFSKQQTIPIELQPEGKE